jgi:transposase InsO family protein
MQIYRIGYGIKGFWRITDYAIRYGRMVTEKAKHKAKILAFWAKHGLNATKEAFGVKRRTLYLWKAKLKAGGGKLEALNEQSKRPAQVRTREWPDEVIAEIKRQRADHPNLGKDKVFLALQDFCAARDLQCPSISTVGNLIRDLGGLRMFPTKVRHNGQIVKRFKAKKTRKPKHFQAVYPGHCGAFDTIERIVHGSRRYVITFTDLYSRWSFAWATTSHASQAAKEFFDLVTYLFPFPLTYILTDNGSEFMRYFDVEVRRLHKIHWHTYPKTPKMNAHAERFNRTIQEEFIDFHEPELLNPTVFNAKLVKHLLWHNTERPHWSLDLKSPLQFIRLNYPKECNMYLTDTHP